MGALASVLWNVNVRTDEIGGLIEPLGYVSGFGKDRVCIVAFKPLEEKGEGTNVDQTVNNPIVWENFKTNLIKVYKTK